MRNIWRVAVHLTGGDYFEFNIEAKDDLIAREKAIGCAALEYAVDRDTLHVNYVETELLVRIED